MDINSLRSSPHLSASAINLYSDCSLAYKFRYVDKLDSEFLPEAMVLGSSIHDALAQFYMGLLTGEKLTLEELKDVFKVSLHQRARQDTIPVQYKPNRSFPALLMEGDGLLEAFFTKLDVSDFTILAVEEAFSFTMPGLDIPIIGVYDLVLEDPSGVITIVDHKTAAKAYSTRDLNDNFQATVYSMAARANGLAHRELLFRFDCLIKTKTPKFEIVYTSRTQEDGIRASRKIMAVWEGIEKGVFIPNTGSWKCSGCGYQSACEQWLDGGQ